MVVSPRRRVDRPTVGCPAKGTTSLSNGRHAGRSISGRRSTSERRVVISPMLMMRSISLPARFCESDSDRECPLLTGVGPPATHLPAGRSRSARRAPPGCSPAPRVLRPPVAQPRRERALDIAQEQALRRGHRRPVGRGGDVTRPSAVAASRTSAAEQREASRSSRASSPRIMRPESSRSAAPRGRRSGAGARAIPAR